MSVISQALPVDEITRQAREISPGRTVLTWLAALLFAVGWLVHRTFMVAWLAGAWSFVAAREGWRAAGRPGGAWVSRDVGAG